MNKFILAIMLAVFSFAAADSAMAQKSGNKGGNKGGNKEQRANMTPEEKATKATDRMTKRYGLDAKQVVSVKAANLSFANQMVTLKGKGKEAKPERQAARQNHKAALKGIFTAEQNVKFEADLAARKARQAERKANGGKGNGKGKGKGAAKGKEEGLDVYDMLGDDDDDDDDDKK
jgi:periplasmic protein CpxP/Spy